jgi:hypothetical protein
VWIILILFIAGFIIQLILNFWAGFILLFIGTALSLIKGYASKPVIKREEEKWAQVTPDEYKKVKAKQEQLKKWDLDLFDITNPLGAAGFIIVAAVCFGVWVKLFFMGYDRLAIFWGWDCFIIFVPHWVTGVRSFLRKDQLIIKINLLEHIMNFLSAPSDVQVLPMLSTKETAEGGRVPIDVRLMVRFLNPPEYFLGLQIQVSINSVQGKDFPYLYCVVIAKQEAGIFRKNQDVVKCHFSNLTLEESESDGVDVLVIRQRTTRSSGYYTNLKASQYIVNCALDIVRNLLKS